MGGQSIVGPLLQDYGTCMNGLSQECLLQWNLAKTVTYGLKVHGCNRVVAALKRCVVYGVLPLGP